MKGHGYHFHHHGMRKRKLKNTSEFNIAGTLQPSYFLVRVVWKDLNSTTDYYVNQVLPVFLLITIQPTNLLMAQEPIISCLSKKLMMLYSLAAVFNLVLLDDIEHPKDQMGPPIP